jgi:hypothetical protein
MTSGSGSKIKRIAKIFLNIIVYFFAVVGFVLTGGFFAIRLHLTDTPGNVDANNSYFDSSYENSKKDEALEAAIKNDAASSKEENLDEKIERLSKIRDLKNQNYCKIEAIGSHFPPNAKYILDTYGITQSDYLVAKMIPAVALQLLENQDFQTQFGSCDSSSGSVSVDDLKSKFENAESQNAFYWVNKEEWQAIRQSASKDKAVIEKVSQMTKVDERLLVSCLIGEQLRLFNSQRELFKKFFEPLKILGNANKISLGVMGIKEATAEQIENNLKNQNSPYYLGKDYENILDGENEKSRYDKLTDETHYYSYLYGALYLKQMMKQWKDAGYDIKFRPEIVGTLFNVGFPQSRPKPNPKVGGSEIDIGGVKYSFGRIAYEFYYSGEMMDIFPYDTEQKE